MGGLRQAETSTSWPLSSLDDDGRYLAVSSRDARFDGWLYVGVTSTGIYCRPSCPARTPRRRNVRFFAAAAAAQSSGFRACKRCRPDAAPGSPEWDRRADLAARAMRLIADGVVDRGGVGELSRQLGYSGRHLSRLLVTEVGAGPLAIARSQRASTARVLIETTGLAMTDVAFAAGFASVRQFNDTVQAVFGTSPSALRAAWASRRVAAGPGTISLRLSYRAPAAFGETFRFLAERAVAGVEAGGHDWYQRTMRLPHGAGAATVSIGPSGASHLDCKLALDDLRDLTTAVRRIRRMFDLDADPESVTGALRECDVIGPVVRACPGLRIPGHVDAHELAFRAVLGQQVSVRGARRLAERLVSEYGKRVGTESTTAGLLFPDAAVLAGASPDRLPMPATRARALVRLAEALASGTVVLDAGADRELAARRLLELPGIGPWTTSYVMLRGLGDPDAFLPSDLGVRRALERAGRRGDPAAAAQVAVRWRPWRSYGLVYLWSTLGEPRPRDSAKTLVTDSPTTRKERVA